MRIENFPGIVTARKSGDVSEPLRMAGKLLKKTPEDQYVRRAIAQPVRFGSVVPKKGSVAELQQRGVLVVGANGLMGKDILQNARQNLFNAIAMDQDLDLAQTALSDIDQRMDQAKGKGIIKDPDYRAIREKTTAIAIDGKRIDKQSFQGGYKPGDIPPAGLVVEAIFENLKAKQALFKNLERLLPRDTILATNTSSLSVNDIAAGVKYPDRVIGLHYFMPAISNRLIEVIPGDKTSPDVVEKTLKYARAIGKIPVLVHHDSPGFVANRLLLSVALEGFRLYQDGYGSPETIDKVAKGVLWPELAEIPAAQDKLMPPFALFKKYGSLGVEILKNLSSLGPYYQVSPILLKEHERVQALKNGPLPEARAEFKRAWRQYLDTLMLINERETNAPLSQLKNLELAYRLKDFHDAVSQNMSRVNKLEAESHYFYQGFPSYPQKKFESKKAQEALIEQRLLGAYYGVSQQMVAEGLCTPEDIENIARLGFKWTIRPRTQPEITAALDAMKARYGSDFKIPAVLHAQPAWLKTDFNPKNGSFTITLDRVQRFLTSENYHTLSSDTLEALLEGIHTANADPRVKSIVIQSNGGKVFSGGADLEELKSHTDKAAMEQFVELGRLVMDAVANSAKPTIAKIHGDAYGGGVELALACDRIVASSNATFTLPEVNLGIFPAWGGTERLPQKVGKPLAKALILGGKSRTGMLALLPKPLQTMINQGLKWDIDTPGYRLDAETARQVGLVDKVVPRQALDDTLEALLSDPVFLQKPNPHRGLQRYSHVNNYPPDIASRYHLATIEADTRAAAGQYSQKSWAIANRLIDLSDTPEAGEYSQKELDALFKDATTRNEKLMQLVEAGISSQKGNQTGSVLHLGKALLTDKRLLPGLLSQLRK